MGIERLNLHKFKGTCDLAGIEVLTKSGELYRHLGDNLDPEAISTISLVDFQTSEIKMVKHSGSQNPVGLKFFTQGEAPNSFDTTFETHAEVPRE